MYLMYLIFQLSYHSQSFDLLSSWKFWSKVWFHNVKREFIKYLFIDYVNSNWFESWLNFMIFVSVSSFHVYECLYLVNIIQKLIVILYIHYVDTLQYLLIYSSTLTQLYSVYFDKLNDQLNNEFISIHLLSKCFLIKDNLIFSIARRIKLPCS